MGAPRTRGGRLGKLRAWTGFARLPTDEEPGLVMFRLGEVWRKTSWEGAYPRGVGPLDEGDTIGRPEEGIGEMGKGRGS